MKALRNRRGVRATISGISLAWLFALIPATPVAACSAIFPSLDVVADGSRYIVLAKVTAATDTHMTLVVRSTLKGDVDPVLTVKRGYATVCHDRVEGYAGDIVIFAKGFSYGGERLDAFWLFDAERSLVSASVLWYDRDPQPTVSSVSRAILLRQLPATSTLQVPVHPEPAGPFLALAFLAALGLAWRLGPRRDAAAPGHMRHLGSAQAPRRGKPLCTSSQHSEGCQSSSAGHLLQLQAEIRSLRAV